MDAWIRTTLTPGSFHETAGLGATIRALGVGQVVESASDALAVGDWIYGLLSAQTHALIPADALTKLDLSKQPPAPRFRRSARRDHGPHCLGRPDRGGRSGGQ